MTDPGRRDAGRTVTVPERVARAIERRMDGARFGSVDEYATVALELLLSELERQPEDAEGDPQPDDSGEEPPPETSDTEAVREQLESLGYL